MSKVEQEQQPKEQPKEQQPKEQQHPANTAEPSKRRSRAARVAIKFANAATPSAGSAEVATAEDSTETTTK